MQHDPRLDNERKKNLNKLDALYTAVKKYAEGTGDPVVISMGGNNAKGVYEKHAVLAVRLEKDGDTSCQVIVNDSNSPGIKRILLLTKSNGKITDWSYEMGRQDGVLVVWGSKQTEGEISFRTSFIDRVYNAAKRYGKANSEPTMLDLLPIVDTSDYFLLFTNTPNFDIESNGVKSSGTSADLNDLLIPNVTDGDSENAENYAYWVETTGEVIFYNLTSTTTIDLGNNDNGVVVEVPSGSKVQINVDQNQADITTPKGSTVKVQHETLVGRDIDTITTTCVSGGQVRSVLTGKQLVIQGCIGTVTLEAKTNGTSDTKTVTGIKEGEAVYVTIQNNKIVAEVKDDTTTPPGPTTLIITNAPGSLQYKSSVTLTASEPATWSSDSSMVNVNSSTGKVESVRSFIKSGTAKITASSLDGQRTDSIIIQIKPAWWQWLIIVPLFGWIWY